MSKIVDSYIKLNELFNLCGKNQFGGDFNLDDTRTYYVALDNFVKIAREHYSNEKLDIYSACELFRTDIIAQEELQQYQSKENSNISKGKIK